MARHRNIAWNLQELTYDNTLPNHVIQLALLMDIRDELQSLNRVMHCHNTLDIPHILKRIEKNTTKPNRKTKSKKRK